MTVVDALTRKGFTLLELCLSATILTLALLACFGLFEWGSRSFLLVHTRSGLQGEARRAQLSLLADLRRSDFGGLTVINSTVMPSRLVTASDGTLVERDAYSIWALDDWDSPISFDPANSQPLWNRYQAVYATTTNPGLLVKQVYSPPGSPYSIPKSDLMLCLNNNPGLNPGARPATVLCQSVHSFAVVSDADKHNVTISLTLSSRGTRKGEKRNVDERFEATFGTRLENSQP